LQQQFLAANVVDPELVLDPKPQRFPGRTELPGRIRGVSDNGKAGRLLIITCSSASTSSRAFLRTAASA
jgi:hypothetical protein